jgi:hypothetical protein
MEASETTLLFSQDLHGCVKRLIFKKYVWYDERA